MTRQIPFTPDEYFHIYNRGTNKMPIFNSISDYERFVKLLYLANSKETLQFSDINKHKIWETKIGETLVSIGAWCLMPNHFHLLIKSKNEKSTSLFIQRLLISHSKYFNTKYERNGSLFQGKSKSSHIDNENYLKYIFSYIHLNPLKLIDKNWKEKICSVNKQKNQKINYLNKYKYSSLSDYRGEKRNENKILDKNAFPFYFLETKNHLNDLQDWFTDNEKPL